MEDNSIVKLSHHLQQQLCHTRSPYRQGRKFTSVKVYTINDESQHIIVCGVPKLNLLKDLKNKFSVYGVIKNIFVVDNYPNEDFTETIHVHYSKIQSARISKRFLDGYNFYGGVLHVFYAPELESQTETKQKLLQRRKNINYQIKKHQNNLSNPITDSFMPMNFHSGDKEVPTIMNPSDYFTTLNNESISGINHQKSEDECLNKNTCNLQLKTDTNKKAKKHKIKNYKGQTIKVKNSIGKFAIGEDTNKVLTIHREIDNNKTFWKTSKLVDSGIKIIIPLPEEKKKKIIINDSSITKLV